MPDLRFAAVLFVLTSGLLHAAGCATRDVGADPRPVSDGRTRAVAAGSADPVENIRVDRLRDDVYWLADPAREGRGLRTQGLDDAADFIAQRFADLGLEPLEGLDDFFHRFEMTFGADLVRDQTLLAVEGQEPLELGADFNPLAWSAPGSFSGELVFAGYGVGSPASRERHDYDDFDGVDVTGKVAIVFRYEPHDTDGNSRFTGGRVGSRESFLSTKAAAAQRAGAAALLVVDPPLHRPGADDADELMPFGVGRRQSDIPAFHLTRDAATRLLDAAGLPTLDELQREIDTTGRPASRESETVVAGAFDATSPQLEVRNVVGVLPGKNRDEFVVIGGHYDHVGFGAYGSRFGYGEVHPGADDNASGTASVLMLAEAFAEAKRNGYTPQRSLLFMAFTAEEVGLVGSRNFADDPPVDRTRMVGMVNLDMVGRLRDGRIEFGGLELADAFMPAARAAVAAEPGIQLIDGGSAMSGRSDHASFNRIRVPAIFFFTGLHPEYHAPSDTADTLDYDGLAAVTRVAARFVMDVTAADRSALEFREPPERNLLRRRQTTQPSTTPATQPATRPAA